MRNDESEAFFPGREVLKARRVQVRGGVPSDPSEAGFRRTVAWVAVSTAVFTQVFASAVLFGWITLRSSLEVLLCATSCILAVAGALAAGRLRRASLRASNALSRPE